MSGAVTLKLLHRAPAACWLLPSPEPSRPLPTAPEIQMCMCENDTLVLRSNFRSGRLFSPRRTLRGTRFLNVERRRVPPPSAHRASCPLHLKVKQEKNKRRFNCELKF